MRPVDGNVRPAAEIDEFSGGVKRHHRLDGFFLDQFALEALIPLAVELEGLGLRQHLALVGNVLRGELVHLFFDALEVFGRERLLAQKFVEEAVVDRRADAQLHVGKKFEHRRGQQVRRRVPEHLQRLGIFRGENPERGVVFERPRKIDSSPSARATSASRARPCEILRAISAGVVPRGTSCVAPSGKVICMVSMGDFALR